MHSIRCHRIKTKRKTVILHLYFEIARATAGGAMKPPLSREDLLAVRNNLSPAPTSLSAAAPTQPNPLATRHSPATGSVANARRAFTRCCGACTAVVTRRRSSPPSLIATLTAQTTGRPPPLRRTRRPASECGRHPLAHPAKATAPTRQSGCSCHLSRPLSPGDHFFGNAHRRACCMACCACRGWALLKPRKVQRATWPFTRG